MFIRFLICKVTVSIVISDMEYDWPILLLLLSISGAFVFMAGKKLLGKMTSKYKRWGYPVPFMYIQAVAELIGVWGIWVEEYQFLSAVMLAIVPFAAIVTNTRYYEEARSYWLPAITFVMLGVLMWVSLS